MGLSCECSDRYPEPGDWSFTDGGYDYTTLETSTRRRCCSCKDLIDLGATVLMFYRAKVPGHDVEIAIYGEEGEIPLAPWYHCERCADLYFSLVELGFCEQPGADQRELVKEYAAMQKEAQLNRLAGVNQLPG